MRLAPLVWAGFVLSACTVDVEGAPCGVPGATVDCPGGQACGNDLRCSARALACAGSRCTPAAGGDCLADPLGLATGTAYARRCVEADPVCGAWEVVSCPPGLGCGHQSGGAGCECPANPSRRVAVLAGGSPAGPPLFPSGLASPPACAFRSLTDALAHAETLRDLDPAPAASVVVWAGGEGAGTVRTFSAERGERFPLVVAERVRLASDGPDLGGVYEIVYDPDAGASAAAWLAGPGAELHGFTIRNARGSAADVAVAASCPGGVATVTSVTIEGRSAAGARLGTGIAGGGCVLVARGVQVRNVAGAGIAWGAEAAHATATLAFSEGTIEGNGGPGIVARGGVLELDRVRVAGNGGRGIDLTGGGAPFLILRDSRIVRNGDAGVAVQDGSIHLYRSTIFGNLATTRWGGGAALSGIQRRGGGVVISGSRAAVWMEANRIYANGGDQILVVGPIRTASLDGAGESYCVLPDGSPRANVIGCFDPTPADTIETGLDGPSRPPYRGIVAVQSDVAAGPKWWDRDSSDPRDVIARIPEAGPLSAGRCGFAYQAPTFPLPIVSCESEDPPAGHPYR